MPRAESLETAERQRIEAVVRGIERRVGEQLDSWRSMLADMTAAPVADEELSQDIEDAADPACFVDWFAISRIDGRDVDVGMHRHHIDPTIPFAAFVMGRSHGALITSATLRDGSGDPEHDWARGRGDDGRAPPEGAGHPRRAPLPLRLWRADPACSW